MEKERLYIVPRGCMGDKNNNLQLQTDNLSLYLKAKSLFLGEMTEKFPSLNFFLQGDSGENRKPHWLMIEAWSFADDLFYEAAEYMASELKIRLEI
jgi:hypothetical protein